MDEVKEMKGHVRVARVVVADAETLDAHEDPDDNRMRGVRPVFHADGCRARHCCVPGRGGLCPKVLAREWLF